MPKKQVLVGGVPKYIHERWHEQIQHDCCDEWKDYHIITGNRRTVERWITKHGKDYAKHRIKQFLELE